TFSFSTTNIKRDFRSLAFNIVQFKPNTPWKVSKKEELLAINKTWSLQLKEGMEKIILINWTAFEFSEECFLFGWLMLTNLRVIFLSLEHTQKWSAQVLNIEAPNNQRSGINISYQNKLHFFLCFGGVRFSKLFWNKIAMIKPPPEISSARSGQSVDKIIGPSRQALVYKNQYPIHKLTSIKVIKRSQSILIQCDKLPATELTEGSIIEVEIPKEVGRFRFYTTVKEVNLVRPTPMRVYMLSVALPDNIYVYNQRKAFRVPFQQEVTIDLCRIEKPIRYYLTDELEIETSLEAEIFDLSFEGVGLLLPNSLQDESPKTLMIRFSFSLFDQNVQVQGTIRHVGYLAEKEKWSHGIHFVNLPPQTEQKIFQEVLKLERELLRSAEEDQ
ncbi:MAG: PilZ domain-containing protein, partial [Myxococcota bacterium]|nr:PilZ domain-containing protein [Myxococcota bacterium]